MVLYTWIGLYTVTSIHRMIRFIFILFGPSLISFQLSEFVPGDAAELMLILLFSLKLNWLPVIGSNGCT